MCVSNRMLFLIILGMLEFSHQFQTCMVIPVLGMYKLESVYTSKSDKW